MATKRKTGINTAETPKRGVYALFRTSGGVTVEVEDSERPTRYEAQRFCTAATRAYIALGWKLTACNMDFSQLTYGDVVDTLRVKEV